MRFAIESDAGSEIRGWLVPDDPSRPGLIRVVVSGGEMSLQADLPRPDLVAHGLSPSESVGFVVDRTTAPGVENAVNIEIFDAESGAPLYKRLVERGRLERKLILFDAAAAPQRTLIQNLASHFAIVCSNIERFSPETLTALLANSAARSIAFHGRPHLTRILGVLGPAGRVRAALLRDPFEELAERLLFLNLLAQSAPETLIARLAVGIEPLMDLARHLRLDDYKTLLGDFRRLTDPQRRAIASPMVRLFGCEGEAAPARDDVARALDNLAALDVVGVRARYSAFRSTLAQFLGADVLGVDEPAASERTLALAKSLSRIGLAVDLLAHDVELYADVVEAIDAGLAGRDGLAGRSNQII